MFLKNFGHSSQVPRQATIRQETYWKDGNGLLCSLSWK
jgi:hypothetical protein